MAVVDGIAAGQRFGRWTAISDAGKRKREYVWNCRCDCGTVRLVSRSKLLRNGSRSCGCAPTELLVQRNLGVARTHGLHVNRQKPRWLGIWHNMMQRCHNPKHQAYAMYGGVGIAVCDRWHEKMAFFEDMGNCPPGLTLDRIDNTKGYEPGNCRWANWSIQRMNQRRTPWITFEGRTMRPIDWARELGLSKRGMSIRLKKWPLEIALTRPVDVAQSMRSARPRKPSAQYQEP